MNEGFAMKRCSALVLVLCILFSGFACAYSEGMDTQAGDSNSEASEISPGIALAAGLVIGVGIMALRRRKPGRRSGKGRKR